MRRLRALVAAGVVAATVALGGGAGAAVDGVVRHVDVTRTPLVTVDVGAAGGADPTGVSVREAGADVAGARVERLPSDDLQVVLAVDTSGSMAGGPIDAAKHAAGDFISRMAPTVRLAVVGFGAAPYVASPMSLDRAAARGSLAGLTARGETALYDAVGLAVQQFQGSTGRREIVLLSDGGDTVSKGTLDAAVAAVSGAGVTLDAVELVSTDANRAALEALAVAGHGSVVSASAPAALADVYARVAASLTSEYRVTFSTSGHGATPVDVVVHTAAGDVAVHVVLALPLAAAPAAGPAGPAAATPPVTVASPAPGAAGLDGARPTGAAPRPVYLRGWMPLALGGGALFLSLLLALSGALGPVQRRARLARLGHRRRAAADGSALHRIAERAAEKADEALEGDVGLSLNRALDKAGLALRPGEYVVLAGCGVVTAGMVGLLFSGLVLAVLLGVVVAGVACAVPGAMAERRRQRFADQLGDTLQLLASSLRAGYGLLQAADAVAREAESPTADEFRRVLVETRLGRDLSASLRAAAARVGVVDFDWVVQAIEIQREVGGDLAEILDNVGATIRDRNQLRRQVRALTAEGRFSAYVLMALPVLLAVMMRMINPDYMSELFHGAGLVMIGVCVVLMTVGGLWLKKLCRPIF